MYELDSSCSRDGTNYCLKIKDVRVRAIWLCHGSIAAPASFFSGALTANPLTHWWVEIETEVCNEWFCAQFNGNRVLSLTRHNSMDEVTQAGKRAAGREGDNANITTKAWFKPPFDETMGNVFNWMKGRDPDYDLISNNCQDFGDAFSCRFGQVKAANTPRGDQAFFGCIIQ